jgi:hypothetical protein
MKHIANVLYFDELVNHNRASYINYCKNITEINPVIPTLVVGWRFLKYEIFDKLRNIYLINNNVSLDILDSCVVPNNLYWEFSFDENKSSHINGVESFVLTIPHSYFSNKYDYVNVDPIFMNITQGDNNALFGVLPTTIDCLYNNQNEMLYMLSEHTVYGLSLELYSFLGFDNSIIIDKCISRLNNKNKYFFDEDGKKYLFIEKNFILFENIKRYLCCLL